MQYPGCIEWGDDFTATGIQIPDIPGGMIPMPTLVANHHAHEDYAGMGRGMLALDISPYLGKTKKVNVTLPGYVIQRSDRNVREHKVKRRSSFLADAALEKLARS